MKNRILIIIILVIIVISFIGIFIYKNRTIDFGIEGDNAKGIKLTGKETIEKIYYSYSGTYIGSIYTYEIYKEENEVKLKIKYMNINEDNPDIVTINNDTLDKIMELVKKHHANKWHGYDKYATHVLDGSGFSIEIRLNNKKNINISGYNCAPNGYYSFEKEVLSLIEDDVNNIKKKYNL